MKLTQEERSYFTFIERLKLRHFNGMEFIAYARRMNNGGVAGIPDKSKWENIVPTLQVLDLLRAYLGQPITLTSTYRSNGYNKACGGASHSQHKEFRACDIQVSGVTPKRVFNTLINWREEGVFKGGVGLYETFVHFDTRGRNATWGD